MAIDEGFACLAAVLASSRGDEAGSLAVGVFGKMSLKAPYNTARSFKESEAPVAADHHENENKNTFS